MKLLKTNLWLLLALLLVFGCRTDDQDTLPKIPQRSTSMVSAEDIPLVMTSLSERLNLRQGDTQTANSGQVDTGLGQIDLEQIFEVIDTLSNAHYTFLVDDQDDDLFTFTNLVVKKREDGAIDPPYLLLYTVDSLHRDAFLESGFSMEHFTGIISKRFLTSFSTQLRGSANLGGQYDALTTEPCDYDTRATGGGGVIGNTDPFPPAGTTTTGGGYMQCDFVTVSRLVTTCYKSDIGSGPRCYLTTKYVTKSDCYWVGHSQDVYDGTNCPDPETGEVGVLTKPDYCSARVDIRMSLTSERSKEELEAFIYKLACDMEANHASRAGEIPLMYFSLLADNYDILSTSDMLDLAQKARRVYERVISTSFDPFATSTMNPADVAMVQDLVRMSIFPTMKRFSGSWPEDDEWGEIFEAAGPLLLELALSIIPGGEIILIMRDVAAGDYQSAVTNLGIMIGSVVGLKLVSVAYKFYKAISKTYKVFTIARKFIGQIASVSKAGLNWVLKGNRVDILDDAGTLAAKIENDIIEIFTVAGRKMGAPSKIRKLKKAEINDRARINASELTDPSKTISIKATESELKRVFDRLKGLDNHTLGNESEDLIKKLFNGNDDYVFHRSHISGTNGNQGFDGVFIKRNATGDIENILVNETKQVSNGGIQLNPANPETRLPQQMSDGWLDDVIRRMRAQGGEIENLANLVAQAKLEEKVTKVVTAIDKVKDQIVILKLN